MENINVRMRLLFLCFFEVSLTTLVLIQYIESGFEKSVSFSVVYTQSNPARIFDWNFSTVTAQRRKKSRESAGIFRKVTAVTGDS